MLISDHREEAFHAWREAFPRVVVQVLQSDLLSIRWCRDLGEVEINGIVVG